MRTVLGPALSLVVWSAAAPVVMTQPDWVEKPNASDLARDYPKLAEARSIEGRAVISCRVDASGRLQDCRAVSESPHGYGFGAAALAMAPRFHMRPMTVNGRTVDDGKINIPINFRLPQGPARSASERAAIPGWEFALYFIGMWLVVTTVLGVLSGWFSLQRRYGHPNEPPLLRLQMVSGRMGFWVSLRGVLTLSAYPSGLGVAVWRIFGPFERPFLVPWAEIDAVRATSFFEPVVRLSFGSPEAGRLTIRQGAWERLSAAAAGHIKGCPDGASLPLVKRGTLARAFLWQWLAMTGGAAAFYSLAPHYVAARTGSAPAHVPLAVAFGFPAVVFGVVQIVRFVVQTQGARRDIGNRAP